MRSGDADVGFADSTVVLTREGLIEGEIVNNDDPPDNETGEGLSFSEAGDDINPVSTSLSISASILAIKTE